MKMALEKPDEWDTILCSEERYINSILNKQRSNSMTQFLPMIIIQLADLEMRRCAKTSLLKTQEEHKHGRSTTTPRVQYANANGQLLANKKTQL